MIESGNVMFQPLPSYRVNAVFPTRGNSCTSLSVYLGAQLPSRATPSDPRRIRHSSLVSTPITRWETLRATARMRFMQLGALRFASTNRASQSAQPAAQEQHRVSDG